MECTDICGNQVPLVGKYNPQQYVKEMYMHERQAKDTFSSEKMSITLILSFRMAQSLFCSGLARLCAEASPAAQRGYRPVRQHRAGFREEGGRSGREEDTDQRLFLALIGSGRVYCRKWEIGRRGRGVRMREGVG